MMTMEQVYLWTGLLILGLADLYLYRYPVFHPLVLIPAVGWLWGDLSTGLVVGGTLEFVFGLAYFHGIRKLTLILYAGGLAVVLNQGTHNINLTLSLGIALLISLGIESAIRSLKDWQKWLVMLGISGAFVLLLPQIGELFGSTPAGFLNQVAVSGGILAWIFFAYAIWGVFQSSRSKEITLAIPAILVGSTLSLKLYFWGPVAFVLIYYILLFGLKNREIGSVSLIDGALIILGIYVLLPNLAVMTFWVFGGLLALNILLVARKFSPLEIFLINFIAGIILARAGLLY